MAENESRERGAGGGLLGGHVRVCCGNGIYAALAVGLQGRLQLVHWHCLCGMAELMSMLRAT